ncbi:MAG: protease HtpX [Gammaproteobacteria bacterium]|nr:protease HtpX [Gammaproteobacteria bacterium]
MGMRLLLFLLTNFSVVLVLSISARVLGLDHWLAQQGMAGQLNGLLLMSLAFGFGGAFISLAISKWMAKRSMGVRVIEAPGNATEKWLLETVRRQAGEAGISMPEVGIFDTPQLNAFATGMKRNDALVAVSTGLLGAMNRDEVEAVLGHEVSHVANGDMITMGLLQGVLNTFVIFISRIVGLIVDKAVFKVQRGIGPGYFIASIIAEIILGILAAIIASWFSRRREFRADAGGARLAGREKMIAALQRLQKQYEPDALPGQLAAFGISGGVKSGLQKLLMSHPPLTERIAALHQAG